MKDYHERDENGIIDAPEEGKLIEISIMDHSQKVFRTKVGTYSSLSIKTKEGKEIQLNEVARWKYVSKDEYDSFQG